MFFFFIWFSLIRSVLSDMISANHVYSVDGINPATDDDFKAAYTHIIFDDRDCTILPFIREDIIQSFWDAARILNLKGIKEDINWDSPAAVEFLGSPFSKPSMNQIQGRFFF